MRNKIIWGSVAIVFLAIVIFAIGSLTHQKSNIQNNKLKVVTTLFPLYDMAKNIGGDKADVSQLLPPGVEAHSFEPKPSDIVKINEADFFVYTGKFMETWAEDIIKGITNKNVKVVDSSNGIQLDKENNEEEHEDEHEDAHEEGIEHESHHHHDGVDPHIWLDFDNAQVMADNIANAFIEKDPSNVEFYKNNANEYKNKLIALDNNYRNTLEECNSKVIVYGGHYAFGYLANRYGLKYLAAQGVSPDAEPTANDLANLVDQINKDKVKYVFYEELTSPKIAETIAGETKAKMLLLNAAHNLAKDQFEAGLSFFDILNSDLENLKVGLECK